MQQSITSTPTLVNVTARIQLLHVLLTKLGTEICADAHLVLMDVLLLLQLPPLLYYLKLHSTDLYQTSGPIEIPQINI